MPVRAERRRVIATVGVVGLVLGGFLVEGGAAPASGEARDGAALARQAASQFLDRYVAADGRVVRRDQGSDTVAEGQAYALVLAQVAGNESTFERVWRWTARALQRPDGLLANHATSSGVVDDAHSASDADLLAAWALLRARGANRPLYAAAGRAMAAAILDRETFRFPDGREALAAGDWATGSPGTLNPSYWAIPVLDDLARRTGDPRWSTLAAESVRLVDLLTGSGQRLPPDWARVDGLLVRATPAPSGAVPDVRYSLDAQRVIVWLAVATGPARRLAADWWPRLPPSTRAALALDPEGRVLDAQRHPTALVAAAAAAFAAGQRRPGVRLLDDARTLDDHTPTYYGSAWVALGRAFLTTNFLGARS